MNNAQQFSRRANRDFLQHPAVWVAIIGLASVVCGFVVSRDIPIPLFGYGILAAVVVALAFVKAEYAAAALLVLNWGNIGDVLIRYQDLPSLVKPLVALLALVLVVRRFGEQQRPLVSDPTTWWMLAYLAITSLGVWYASYPDRVEKFLVDFAKDLVIFVILINLLGTRQAFERTIWMLLIVGTILGSLSVYQEVTKTYDDNYGGFAQVAVAQITTSMDDRARAAGPIGDPNYYGQILVVLVPLGFWAALNGRTWRGRFFGAFATAACLAGIGLSFSRGAYLAAVVVLVLYAMYERLDPRYLLVLPLLGALLWIAPPEFRARFGTLDEILPGNQASGTFNDSSLQGRSVKVNVALNMFGDYPMLGIGKGNYRSYYQQYIRELGGAANDTERDAHNLYLEVLAEQGLIGLGVFAGVLLCVWQRLRRARRLFNRSAHPRMASLAVALQVGFAGYLVTAIFLHGAYLSFLWLLAAMAVAMVAIARRNAAEAQPAAVATGEGAQPALGG